MSQSINLRSKIIKSYDFHRPLTQNEWGILRSYTRRIRSLAIGSDFIEIGWESLLKPPAGEPLFSNLHHLDFHYTTKTRCLLVLPFPSLTFLDIQLYDQQFVEDTFKSLAGASPSLRELTIQPRHYNSIDMDPIDPTFICHWRNLQSVICFKVPFGVLTLVHLSRIPILISLGFTLHSTLPVEISPSDSPLVFSNLKRLALFSELLDPILQLLSQIRLPVVLKVTCSVESPLSRQDLSTFFAGVHTSGSLHTIEALALAQSRHLDRTRFPTDRPVLGLEDLQPLASSNLRSICLDIEWKVDLADSELLTLASTWPHLEVLFINPRWGWNTEGGITPNGLLRLLQTCPSLTTIALVVDTRGYTDSDIPPSPANLGSTEPRLSDIGINVLDSFIEEKTVPVIAAFFAGLASSSKFRLRYWDSPVMPRVNQDIYNDRWKDVFERVKVAVH